MVAEEVAMHMKTGLGLLFAILLVVGGCRQTPGATLPRDVPQTPDLRFTGAAEGWPPRPQGRTNVAVVQATPLAGSLGADQFSALRQTAVQDARVIAELGSRFAYITGSQLDAQKDQTASPTERAAARLTFYSYSNNVAVEVIVRGGAVESVARREGYQPPEGAEEMERAITLARQDANLRRSVTGMTATAILTYPAEGKPGYGHRVLHVSFTPQGGDVPQYYALIDLTDQKVIVAAALPRP
jgi:hypothetical protein